MVLRLYTFGYLVFDVATDPLWTNLCRGCIMGRFSSYKEALIEAIEGGDYELIESRVTWEGNGVTTWLTQANTSVG